MLDIIRAYEVLLNAKFKRLRNKIKRWKERKTSAIYKEAFKTQEEMFIEY